MFRSCPECDLQSKVLDFCCLRSLRFATAPLQRIRYNDCLREEAIFPFTPPPQRSRNLVFSLSLSAERPGSFAGTANHFGRSCCTNLQQMIA